MRSREFVVERRGFTKGARKGKMPHTAAEATPGAIRNKGYYDLYRASMAVAGMDKDGNNDNLPDPSSWIGGEGYMGSYTEEEGKMARAAFKKLGFTSGTHMPGPSQEPDGVETHSPIKPFKGYPR